MEARSASLVFSRLLLIVLLLGPVAGAGQPSAGPARIDSLVDADWLAAHLDEADVVVLDCSVIIEADGAGGFRPVSGRPAYDEAHIPTAGFADLFGDLSESESEFRFAVPAPEQFAAAMGALGVYARPGHIPGASNVPMTELMDDSGRFRSAGALSRLFGDERDARTITYCGGGIAASADAFIMVRPGFEDVAVYAASLQEWAADPENPMTSGGVEARR